MGLEVSALGESRAAAPQSCPHSWRGSEGICTLPPITSCLGTVPKDAHFLELLICFVGQVEQSSLALENIQNPLGKRLWFRQEKIRCCRDIIWASEVSVTPDDPLVSKRKLLTGVAKSWSRETGWDKSPTAVSLRGICGSMLACFYGDLGNNFLEQ